MIYRLFRLNPYNFDDRNAWHLIVEIFWSTMLAAVTTFNAAFAIRLGASNTMVSLLTSLPALLAVLISIPAGQFLNSKRRRKPWLLGSLILYRAGFLLVGAAPLLSFLKIPRGTLIVLVIVLITIPAHFFNVGFIPMLTDIVPEKKRAGVFAARNIISSATLSVCGFLFGLWLDRILFPINYQLMYVFGFLASMVSVYYLLHIQVPDSNPPLKVETGDRVSFKKQWYSFYEAWRKHSSFFQITGNTILHGMGLWAVAPIYVLYYVRSLGASDSWLGLLGSVSSLSTIFGYAFWRWLMGRWGESATLKRTIVLAGVFPILVGLLPSLTAILFVVILNGLIAPGLSLSHLNTLMKVTPAENRPGYTALYITIANICAFLLPFAGIAVANRVGFAPTLIASGVLSCLGSTSFWWWPVHAPDSSHRREALPSPVVDITTD